MDDLLEQFHRGAAGTADVDMDETLWAIIRDVQGSYDLALRAAGVPGAIRAAIKTTVDDYLANHYGDD